MNLLAIISSLALVTSSLVEGIKVSRTSLFGYVVDGVVGTLSALAAARAVESILARNEEAAVDASWQGVEAVAAAAVKAVATVKIVIVAAVATVVSKVASTVKVWRQSFFTRVFEAMTAMSDLGSMSPWEATSASGAGMVVTRVYAKDRVTMGDDYEAAAKVALVLRAKGHRVVAVGNRVQVYATTA